MPQVTSDKNNQPAQLLMRVTNSMVIISIIDRYIMKKFLANFMLSTLLFSLIAIFIDISEKIDDFIKRKPALTAIIFDYYIYFLPWFYGLFGPLFVFLSCIFFNAKLAQNTEIIAILNSGPKYRNVLKPYLIVATILVGAFIFLNTYLIPICEKRKLAFEDEFIREKKTIQSQNLHVQIEPGTMLYIESFNYLDSTGTNLTLERFEKGKVVQRIFANRLLWNKDKGMWKFENYRQRVFTPDGEHLIKGNIKDTTLPIRPSEFIIKSQYISAMINTELNDYIRGEREKGSSKLNEYYVELYKRIANAFSFIPLTLLAVAISSRKVRGGIGLHLGIGIFITLVYLLTVQIFKTLGVVNVIHPAVAVWLPVVIFSFLAMIMIYRAPK